MLIKKFTDALFNGMTANAFKTGDVLSMGWFWMRRFDYQLICRGQDGINIINTQIVLICDYEETLFVIPEQYLPPNTIWHYLRRLIPACGMMSSDSPVCIVKIDADGEMRPVTPNKPLSLVAEPLAAGIIKIRWRYTPDSQEIAPTGFHIYIDSGAGFNFAAPAATVNYGLGGWGEFAWESPVYAHGARRKFCVRSFAEDYGESQNTDYVAAVADALGPDAITGLTAEVEQIS